MRNIFLTIAFLLGILSCHAATQVESSAQVLQKIEKVNDYWQANNTPLCRAFWDKAAYFTGNMEAYRLTGKAQYYDYSDKWCRHNNWMGATSNDKANWKYRTYGEGKDFVLFGDWQICFQTYIDMHNLVPADYKVARAIEVMSHECSLRDNEFWWWADALYMAMPVMTKMYQMTGEVKYLDKLYENFLWSDSLLWDKEAQLYYRDGKYIWPKVKTVCDGGKSFWARGDGWVLAGLAKVLADMPRDYQHRDFFVKRFQQLAEGVARCQQPDGYWSRSMLCENDAPGAETSGTAFFCYGFLWGVNHGYLDRTQYGPNIEKAWQYLSYTAMQSDGSIGYVQPIGEKPDPTKTVNARSQAPFGTGAWLLAACERVRYLDGTASQQPLRGAPRTAGDKAMTVTVTNTTGNNRSDVIELPAEKVFNTLGIAGGRQFLVLDGDNVERPYQLTRDGKVLLQAFVAPMSTTTFTLKCGEPQTARLDCNGHIYPDREDDLTWENDKCAWRMYGPKMHNKGVSGFDTFAKNVTYPVQDALYHSELTSYGINTNLRKAGKGNLWRQMHRDVYTYHRDRGQGMDAYTVGNTLGAGAPALYVNGKLIMPDVYEKADIIENGPLRFTVRLQMYEQNGISETRLLTQDKGNHLARVEVTYSGAAPGTAIASGIVVHKSQPTAYAINKKAGYIAYSDALDTPQGQNGQLFIACLYPQKMKAMKYLPLPEEKAGGTGHVLGFTTLQPTQPFTYYAGSAWSKYDVPTMSVWEQLLKYYADNIKNPLKVSIR